ncbi:MarR family winged helix-turn-helix transcriptional regulator [Brevundimonas sp.]|uniref:MarR family winged helix-turn-helix transcriptional regulator n=1 Tax=Brevundimonas sp. TaxID=1871086 RepID=UPI002737A827|nr:MarR family transcriptional regulator [Brevundimonas sp.]MDP3803566.1 MarR family transcriptional regulator [Brevundimonas sp.]
MSPAATHLPDRPLPDRLGGAPDGKRSLRLWLRLLTCATTIEQTISHRLRDEFGSTLPRFDMLSALDRAGEAGLTMGEVSRMLMVSNGNVTGLAARLKVDGLIEAMAGADRRVQRVRLTPLGQTRFTAMARAHERWIEALFADLTETEADELTRLLERAKRSLHATTHEELNG